MSNLGLRKTFKGSCITEQTLSLESVACDMGAKVHFVGKISRFVIPLASYSENPGTLM